MRESRILFLTLVLLANKQGKQREVDVSRCSAEPTGSSDARRGAGSPERESRRSWGFGTVLEMRRLKNAAVALLRFLRVAIVLALILLMFELVFGVLLVEVNAMFD